MQRNQLQQHTRSYPVPSLSMKVFNNMKRPTKGFSGQEVALFPTMLHVPVKTYRYAVLEGSDTRIGGIRYDVLSILYGVSADVDKAYSLKSDNGIDLVLVLGNNIIV
ncbi:hypothetical protein Tco_0763161 [Tanacetum coccineum]